MCKKYLGGGRRKEGFINLIGFARMSTIKERVPLGQEPAEHAVLGVEHGQVLVEDHLEFVSSLGAEEISQTDDLGERRRVEVNW